MGLLFSRISTYCLFHSFPFMHSFYVHLRLNVSHCQWLYYSSLTKSFSLFSKFLMANMNCKELWTSPRTYFLKFNLNKKKKFNKVWMSLGPCKICLHLEGC